MEIRPMDAQMMKRPTEATAITRQDPLAAILAGQLSLQTRRAYRQDLSHLLYFLSGGREWSGLSRNQKAAALAAAFEEQQARALLLTVSRQDLLAFRAYLREQGLSIPAINRRMSGISSVLREVHLQGYRQDTPAAGIRTLRRDSSYSPTVGLSTEQAKLLLAAPEGTDLQAIRDRAMLAVMLRNGLRAAEVVGLQAGDLGEDQGYRVAAVKGKGEKLRKAKLAGPTWEALRVWMDAAGRWPAGPGAPVFVPLVKQGRGAGMRFVPVERMMTTVAVAKLLHKHVASALGEDAAAAISPHSLRHTFITVALEAGASLRRVQYAAGHADPRTTARYDRARENLTDNAADYVSKAYNGAGVLDGSALVRRRQ
jgi:integrase/recombinase XerD